MITAEGDRLPVRGGPHARRNGTPLPVANAKLATTVIAPTPQGVIGLDGARGHAPAPTPSQSVPWPPRHGRLTWVRARPSPNCWKELFPQHQRLWSTWMP